MFKISPIDGRQANKVFKAGVYVGISAMISYVISLIQDDPMLFGQLTPIINIILVTVRQLFKEPSA